MSAAKAAFSASSVIALPPYLTTTMDPANRRSQGSAPASTSARSFAPASSDARRGSTLACGR